MSGVTAVIQKIFGSGSTCMNLDKLLVHRLVSLAEVTAESTLPFMKRNHNNL